MGQDQAQQWEELIGSCGLSCGVAEREASGSSGAPAVRVHSLS